MKDILIKARRAIRFLFYRDISIEDQMLVSNTLDDSEIETLFWKLNKADRHHSIEVLHRTMKHTDNADILKLALLHDIGDILAPANHADFAATLLEPYISEKNYWILKHHGIFQGYYFFHFLGLDRHMRDKFKDSEHWKDCVEFCAKYDQNSFDPEYESLPIETFMPMLKKVLSQTKKSIYKAEA